jgi:hypothetical protein
MLKRCYAPNIKDRKKQVRYGEVKILGQATFDEDRISVRSFRSEKVHKKKHEASQKAAEEETERFS